MSSVFFVIKRAASFLVFAGLLLCADQAKAAVFSLKNVAFSDASIGYTVTGQFKVNTASGSDYKLTDWNIEVFKNSVSNGLFNYNNSANGLSPGDEKTFTICNVDACNDKSLTLTFFDNFNAVYLDPRQGVDAGAGAGNGKQLLGTTALSAVAYTGATGPTGLAGQADFVPFSPFLLSLGPIVVLSRRLAMKKILEY
jgi:hypothetical protein